MKHKYTIMSTKLQNLVNNKTNHTTMKEFTENDL